MVQYVFVAAERRHELDRSHASNDKTKKSMPLSNSLVTT